MWPTDHPKCDHCPTDKRTPQLTPNSVLSMGTRKKEIFGGSALGIDKISTQRSAWDTFDKHSYNSPNTRGKNKKK